MLQGQRIKPFMDELAKPVIPTSVENPVVREAGCLLGRVVSELVQKLSGVCSDMRDMQETLDDFPSRLELTHFSKIGSRYNQVREDLKYMLGIRLKLNDMTRPIPAEPGANAKCIRRRDKFSSDVGTSS